MSPVTPAPGRLKPHSSCGDTISLSLSRLAADCERRPVTSEWRFDNGLYRNSSFSRRTPDSRGHTQLDCRYGTASKIWQPELCGRGKLYHLDFHFFYGSGKNRFWKLINVIAMSLNSTGDGAPAAGYQAAACGFLVRHGIWLRDALQTYERNPECSSFDDHSNTYWSS